MARKNRAQRSAAEALRLPHLDPTFSPAAVAHRERQREAAGTQCTRLLAALEGHGGIVSRAVIPLFPADHARSEENLEIASHRVKSLLWERGGGRLFLAGPEPTPSAIADRFRRGGERSFDVEMMERIYGHWSVDVLPETHLPKPVSRPFSMGGHLGGCRIGFDLGASDWKIAAVIDGEAVFTQECPWNPSEEEDPETHYRILSDGLRKAAGHLPRVDAIGGSAAGVYIGNRVRVASLFRSVPPHRFNEVETLFLRLQEEWGVPFALANDGDVTALAGALSLGVTRLLGIALGSSEACGYVDRQGCLTGWLNELAFVPIDLQPGAPIDDWSGDQGCGAQYLSQQGVIRLARQAGIPLDETSSRAELLLEVQHHMTQDDERAVRVYRSMGRYLAHAIAQYSKDYDLEHVLVLGRACSGDGGVLMVETAKEALEGVYPEVADAVSVCLPDESFRRVGQAIAAASLPEIHPKGGTS